jgi:hypothetical protein
MYEQKQIVEMEDDLRKKRDMLQQDRQMLDRQKSDFVVALTQGHADDYASALALAGFGFNAAGSSPHSRHGSSGSRDLSPSPSTPPFTLTSSPLRHFNDVTGSGGGDGAMFSPPPCNGGAGSSDEHHFQQHQLILHQQQHQQHQQQMLLLQQVC